MEIRLKIGNVIYIIVSLLLAGIGIGTSITKDFKPLTGLLLPGILTLYALIIIMRNRYKINKHTE